MDNEGRNSSAPRSAARKILDSIRTGFRKMDRGADGDATTPEPPHAGSHAPAVSLARRRSDPGAALAGLHDRQREIETVLNTFVDGVITIDSVGTIGTVNDAALQIFGYDAQEIIGRNVEAIVAPSYSAELTRILQEYPVAGATKTAGREREVVGLRRDGTTFPMELSVSELPAAGERKFIRIVRDVSQRKQTQNALSNIVTAIQRSQMVIEFSLDGTILAANEVFCQVMGYSHAELIGRYHRMFVSPGAAEREEYREFWAALRGGVYQSSFFERLAKGGRQVFLQAVYTPILDASGAPYKIIKFATDVTRQQLTAGLLRESEARTKAIVETVVDGIVTIDSLGTIETFNPAASRIFGYESKEIIGHNVRMLMPEPYRGEHDGYLRNYFVSSDPKVIGIGREVVGRRKDGTVFPMELAVSEMVIQGVRRFTGVVRDITERRKFVEQLDEMRRTAEHANDAKSDFLAAMSHEIRTPMNGIVGMIDILSETDIDSEQRKLVDTIKSSAYSLIGIIGDILDFSKLDAGQMRIEKFPISIEDILDSVRKTFWSETVKKSLRMPTYCDPNIPKQVLGDSVRIRQILTNLIGNAVKFTSSDKGPDGTIVVRADLVSSEDDAVRIRFSISDNGIGIDSETQSRLFRPFEQADASTARRFGGTGLGLSIVKRLVSLMDGTISVTSELGIGSSFSFEIPFTVHPTVEEEPKLLGLRILLLSSLDSRDASKFLSNYIVHEGGIVDVVHDRQICLRRLRTASGTDRPYDVVLLGLRKIDDQARETIRHEIATEAAKQNLRVVQMNFTAQKALLEFDENVVSVSATPLNRTALISALAVASGRASPDTQTTTIEKAPRAQSAPTVEEAVASGQLILIAEDNETNRQVFQRQVALLGYAAEIVSDGQQALEAYRTSRYGLILTDCHMPVMDGYRLTEEIRAGEAGTGRHIPIIAVTANALHGESERCLNIGMDDFLVKPVELQALKAKLRKWIQSSNPQVVPSTRATVGKAGQGKEEAVRHLDVDALRRLVGDDGPMIREILTGYEEPSRRTAANLIEAHEARSLEKIRFAAHKLKSSSRAIGAGRLAALCEDIETAAENGDHGAVDDLVPNLIEFLECVVAEIAAELNGSPETSFKDAAEQRPG